MNSRAGTPGRVPLTINGEFLTGKFNAVGLVGREYLRALPQSLARHEATVRFGPGPLRLAVPGGADLSGVPADMDISRRGHLPRHLWGQIDLPWMARDGVIISLCNLGPVAARNGISIIHDTNVYETPGSYPKAFVAYYRAIYRGIGWRHRRIVAISGFVRDAIIRHGIAPPERVRVIHNGVDHVFRPVTEPGILDRLGLAAGRYVLALANTYAHKNISVLIEAFGGAVDTDLKLVLFGKAGAADFREAGIAPSRRVVFTGHVSDGARRALYEHALCFAFPSTTEGFGLPPGEAMALGCPVVVSPCGAIPEMCGNAAIYADPHDPAAWIGAFTELRNSGGARQTAISTGFDRAARLTWRRAADELLDVAAEAVDEMNGPAVCRSGTQSYTPSG